MHAFCYPIVREHALRLLGKGKEMMLLAIIKIINEEYKMKRRISPIKVLWYAIPILAIITTVSMAQPPSNENFTVESIEKVDTLIGYGKPTFVGFNPPTTGWESMVFGIDEGVSTTFDNGSATFFVFGDTWPITHLFGWARKSDNKWDGITDGDAMAVSYDTLSNGLDLYVLPNGLTSGTSTECTQVKPSSYLSVYFPGIQSNPCQEVGLSVPSGVASIDYDGDNYFLLWNQWNSQTYFAYSEDYGVNWNPMHVSGTLKAISPLVPNDPVRFRNVDTVTVDTTAYRDSVSAPCYLPPLAAARNGRPGNPPHVDKGLLIFGAGNPHRASDVFLAYVHFDLLYDIIDCDGDLACVALNNDIDNKIFYFAGVGKGNISSDMPDASACWTDDASIAQPIVKATDDTVFREAEGLCAGLVTGTSGAGELSVTQFKGTDGTASYDKLIMLFQRTYTVYPSLNASLGPALVTANTMTPWAWNGADPQDENPGVFRPLFIPRPLWGDNDVVPPGPICNLDPTIPRQSLGGYGTFIIDRFTSKVGNVNPYRYGIDVVFTLSRWIKNLENLGHPYRVDLFKANIKPY